MSKGEYGAYLGQKGVWLDRIFDESNIQIVSFLQFWTLWRTWIEIAHQKVGTAASASKPSTTKRKEKKKEDFNGLKRRRRRDFYRERQKIHHRTDPHASREGGREGGKKRHKIGQRLYQSEGKRGAPLTAQQILGRRTATFILVTLQGETASKVIYNNYLFIRGLRYPTVTAHPHAAPGRVQICDGRNITCVWRPLSPVCRLWGP